MVSITKTMPTISSHRYLSTRMKLLDPSQSNPRPPMPHSRSLSARSIMQSKRPVMTSFELLYTSTRPMNYPLNRKGKATERRPRRRMIFCVALSMHLTTDLSWLCSFPPFHPSPSSLHLGPYTHLLVVYMARQSCKRRGRRCRSMPIPIFQLIHAN